MEAETVELRIEVSPEALAAQTLRSVWVEYVLRNNLLDSSKTISERLQTLTNMLSALSLLDSADTYEDLLHGVDATSSLMFGS